MRTTIDKAGRVVIPAALPEHTGLTAGTGRDGAPSRAHRPETPKDFLATLS